MSTRSSTICCLVSASLSSIVSAESDSIILQQIEVPETLLKKRKATDKAREERLAAALTARKVSISQLYFISHVCFSPSCYDDLYFIQLASLIGAVAYFLPSFGTE